VLIVEKFLVAVRVGGVRIALTALVRFDAALVRSVATLRCLHGHLSAMGRMVVAASIPDHGDPGLDSSVLKGYRPKWTSESSSSI
jgi:hypothetical protein